jgi:4-amino-4-deoxychorismate lyase
VSAAQGDCVVKIILTRGTSGRGYAPSFPATANRIVCSHAWPDDPGRLNEKGIRARICDLRLSLQPALAGMKHLNRLEQVQARAEWNDRSIHEGILLDCEDYIVSAISSNIFLVTGDRLLTPRMDRCGVRGVMRANILKAFKTRCEQRRISLDMLPEADEVFVCNAVRGVFPVIAIDHWEYLRGPVTSEVQQWLAES